jgi:hypothetical protein
MPPKDIERSLFGLGHTTERLIEGIHIFWLKGRSEDESRRVPATVRQLVGQVVDELRDLIGHGLNEPIRELAEDVAVSLLKAWNVYERRWWGTEHQHLVRSIENADGHLSIDAEETQSPLAMSEWSRFRASFQAMLAALPEEQAVWADVGSLKAQSLVSDTRDKEHLQVLSRAFPVHSLERVLRASDHHPACININLRFAPFGEYSVVDRDGVEQPSAQDSITAAEADQIARELIQKNPDFAKGGVRDWAAAIGEASGKTCSTSTVQKTSCWRQEMKKQNRGRTRGKSPRAVALNGRVEETHGEGDKDAILNELIAQEEAALKAIRESSLSPKEQQAVLKRLSNGTPPPAKAKARTWSSGRAGSGWSRTCGRAWACTAPPTRTAGSSRA